MKNLYIALAAMALPAAAGAQSAVDAYQVAQSDFKGTARFMSMGGAFTALGGDLSTLNQNPAGIGIYRYNEIGATVDINMQSTKTPPAGFGFPNDATQTKVYCNNFGYVGVTPLDGPMKTFNWGVSFNRAVSFDRTYRGYVPSTSTSLSNYVASFTTASPADLQFNGSSYDPYYDSNCDWLSILAYNSYMINPSGSDSNGSQQYSGLFKSNTVGDALFSIREQGYVDEYDISFGGNVENVVYWGLSIGITDLNYKRIAYYSESMSNALVPSDRDASSLTNGAYSFDLNNYKYIKGSGWNIKAGVIIRPCNELRIGLAVHTPTWYSLQQGYNATNYYTFTPTDTDDNPTGDTVTNTNDPYGEYTDDAYFEWKLNAPWRFMVGVAGVIGGKGIISADYEYDGYNSMSMKVPGGYDDWGGAYDFVSDTYSNDQIKNTYKASSTLRLGAEYRVTPQFSVRAGYNFTTSNVKDVAYNGLTVVDTSGTDPSYSFDKTTSHVTCGVGYKYQSWYIDAAYVYRHRKGEYHAYTNSSAGVAPSLEVKDNNSSIVLSTGFKF